MAKARDKRGPLDLDLPERKIILDASGMVADIRIPERLEAMRLIEEMMIAANVAAAETLEKHKSALLYRVHDTPSREKLDGAARVPHLARSAASASPTPCGPPTSTASSPRRATTSKIQQVSEMVLRSQAQAEYAHENYGHFGLNLDRYAHFTSPIRRYADLIVHRALIAALDLGKDGLTDERDRPKLPASPSTSRRPSGAPCWPSARPSDRLLAQFLATKIGAEFMGRVSGVTRSGLFVRAARDRRRRLHPGLDPRGQDYYRYVEEMQAMVGDRTGETFRIGDTVKVRLLEAAPVAGALRFELLSEGARVKPSSGKRGAKRPSRFATARRGRAGDRINARRR